MIQHTGNTCGVGQTCLTFNTADTKEMGVLKEFGFKFNKIHGRYSCYVDCSIQRYIEIVKKLKHACDMAGVRYSLPLRPDYANRNNTWHSDWKAKEWDRALKGIRNEI